MARRWAHALRLASLLGVVWCVSCSGQASLLAGSVVPAPAATPEGPVSAEAALALRPYTVVPAVADSVRDFHAGNARACADRLAPYVATPAAAPAAEPLRYLLGVCQHFAGDFPAAVTTLRPLTTGDRLLVDYARYFAGAALSRSGKPAEALALLQAIPAASGQSRRAGALIVELLLASDPAAAIDFLRDYVDRSPQGTAGLRWKLAETLVAAGRRTEAVEAWWELWARLPGSSEAGRVEDAVERVLRGLTGRGAKRERRRLRRPTVAQQSTRGRALFRAHRSERAIEAFEEVVRRAKRGSEAWCEAHHLIARSWDKLRTRDKAVPHYDAALAHCPHDPARVELLYFGGKSAHQQGLRPRALRLFADLHRAFPEHSFNDDALLREADIHRDVERPAEARAALERALSTYPEGDMREDAAWFLLWEAYTSGDHAEAVRRANRALALIPRESSYRSAGRTLYWRGRALSRLGDAEQAAQSWRDCLTTYPLSWYAGLAYARLHEADARAAAATFRAIVAADVAPAGPLEDPSPVALTARPAFRRGLELLRLGLPAPAGRELATLRGGGESEDDAAADWLRAALWVETGDFVRSHNIARRERPEFATHYPRDAHTRYWRIGYPRPFRTLAAQASERTGVPVALIHSIMREESGFEPAIESWANAVGLMQLLVPTAKGLADREDGTITGAALRDPRLNVKLGSRFLKKLLARFGDHPALAAAAYNAGGGRMRGWLRERGTLPLDEFVEHIPFRQTRGYTKRVMESFFRYRFLYGPNPGEMTLLPLLLPPV